MTIASTASSLIGDFFRLISLEWIVSSPQTRCSPRILADVTLSSAILRMLHELEHIPQHKVSYLSYCKIQALIGIN